MSRPCKNKDYKKEHKGYWKPTCERASNRRVKGMFICKHYNTSIGFGCIVCEECPEYLPLKPTLQGYSDNG